MAAYILNRSTNSSNEKKTPYELWSGERPDISNMRIFGCKVMVHVPKQQRRKWDKKSNGMVFVGYDPNTKGYRVYDPTTRKIHTSRDVIFHEDLNEGVLHTVDNDETDIGFSEGNDATKVESPDDETAENNEFESPNSINESKAETSSEMDESTLNPYEDCNNDADYEPEQPIESVAGTEPRVTRSKGMNIFNPFHQANFALFTEPASVKEAMNDSHAEKWKDAMIEEMKSHEENGTWTLVNLPNGRKSIKTKWVLRQNAIIMVTSYATRQDLLLKGVHRSTEWTTPKRTLQS